MRTCILKEKYNFNLIDNSNKTTSSVHLSLAIKMFRRSWLKLTTLELNDVYASKHEMSLSCFPNSVLVCPTR